MALARLIRRSPLRLIQSLSAYSPVRHSSGESSTSVDDEESLGFSDMVLKFSDKVSTSGTV